MSDCKTIEKWTVDYLDENLTEARRERMDAHLAVCSSCREVIASYRQIRQAYGEVPEEDVSSGIVDSILTEARVEAEAAGPGQSRTRGPVVWTLAAVAALLLVVGLVQLIRLVTTPAPPSVEARVAALLQQGDALRDAGDHDQAEAAYERALVVASESPESAAVHHRLGELYLEAERFGEALAALLIVTGRFPDYGQRDRALLLTGRAQEGLGKLDDAIVTYRLYTDEYPMDRTAVDERIRGIEKDRAVRARLMQLGYIGGDK